jgi:fructokinase
MRKVIGIGETVLDIIFKDNKPIGAAPGGSTFNAVISLGRCGVNVVFIGETGNDRVGKHIIDFLNENGVDSSNVNVSTESQSPVSLAFLNDKNDAEYLFYKDHEHDHLDFVYPEINEDDIVIFGSYYAVNPVIRPQVAGLLDYARSHGAIIYYDVNYRTSHKDDVMKITPNLIENLEATDIIRGSRDDFKVVYNIDDPEKVYNAEISFYCKNFICTDGGNAVTLFSKGGMKKTYQPVPEQVVSTVGAGDNFNAGLVFGLIYNGILRSDLEHGLSPGQWDKVISSAMLFSAESCKTINNYVSCEFGDEMKRNITI